MQTYINSFQQRFTGIKFNPDNGTFTGQQRYDNFDSGSRNPVNFSARFDLFLICQAWADGVNFEDLADGFGKGMGTMGGDWSGIRDSSDDATNKMFERALNHFFGG